MTTHLLKIDLEYLERLRSGEKKAEIRMNNRDFQAGDEIHFQILNQKWKTEGDPRYLIQLDDFQITHVLHFKEGLRKNFVMLSIKKKKK